MRLQHSGFKFWILPDRLNCLNLRHSMPREMMMSGIPSWAEGDVTDRGGYGSCILHLSDLILGKPTGTVFEGCVPVCLVCPSLSVCRAGEHI